MSNVIKHEKIEEKCANSDPAQVWNGPARPGCHFWRRSFLPRKFPAALVFAEKKAKFGTRVLLLLLLIETDYKAITISADRGICG